MHANRTLEIGTGMFVLLGFAALLFLTTQLPASGAKLVRAKPGYNVTAEFDDIGGLKVGSPVTMAGVHIGQVTRIRFDPRDFKAVVTMRLELQYNQIPEDSYASIQTEGLLGGKYIGLSPGGLESYLKDGSRIDQTQSAIVLENIINKLFAGYANKGSSAEGAASEQPDQGKPRGKSGKAESSK